MLFLYVLLYFALSATSASVSNPGAESGYVSSDSYVVVTSGTNRDHRNQTNNYRPSTVVIAMGSKPLHRPAGPASLPPPGQAYNLTFL